MRQIDATPPQEQVPDPDRLGQLIRAAGQRVPVPAARQSRVYRAVHANWQTLLKRRRQRRLRLWSATAAAALVALGLWSLCVSGGSSPQALSPVATVVFLNGAAEAHVGNEQLSISNVGQTLSAGTLLSTTEHSRLTCRLANGQSLRLDCQTRVKIESAQRVVLERGALYVDTQHAVGLAGQVEVQTPLGVARDIGTQFEVRFNETGLKVRVREGKISLLRDSQTSFAEAGSEVAVDSGGTLSRRLIETHGGEWDWVAACAPSFALEGASLLQFLEWVVREQGLSLKFQSEALRQQAAVIKLHGGLDALNPGEALDAVLLTCGLAQRQDQGVILILSPAEDGAPEAR